MRLFLACIFFAGCSQPNSVDQIEETKNNEKQVSPWFEDVATEVGIDYSYFSGDTGDFYIIEVLGGGAALFDSDNDGDLDLYVVQGNALVGELRSDLQNVLYENDGSGHFKNITEGSGANDIKYGFGVTTADYDNDGFVDIYVTNYGQNILLKNNGDNTFEDVTNFAGVGDPAFSTCASFGDLDLDGDLDLYVSNYLIWSPEIAAECFSVQNTRDYCKPMKYLPARDSLYFNNGDGTFTDVSDTSGIREKSSIGFAVTISDMNNDNYPDILVANDGMEDWLWINQKDGSFQEEAMLFGCAVDDSGLLKSSMGMELFDVDYDGDQDLLITTIVNESDSFFLNEEGIFVDATSRFGLAAETRPYTRWGIAVVDFDNDGSVEIYESTGRVNLQDFIWNDEDELAEPNLFLQLNEAGRFESVEPQGGVTEPIIRTAHGVASGDINNDGGVDLIVVNKDSSINLLMNIVEDRGNWILLDIRNSSGSPAIGAKVVVTLQNATKVTKHVRTAHGYASASDPRIHVGLGNEESVQSVEVFWNGQSVISLNELRAGKVHSIIIN
jgi:hypothetical protein